MKRLSHEPCLTDEVLTDLRVEQKNRAKELIEDFMIAANQATASYLTGKGMPSFRRILRSPERWQRIVEVAARWGEHLPPEPDASALESFLVTRRQADPLRFPDLSLAIVKLIGRGEYVFDQSKDGSPEHFGLAVKGYTHSTAPNRRFPDLITQRLIKAALAGAANAVPSGRTEVSGRSLYRERRRCGKSRAAAPQIRRRPVARIADWAALRRHRDGRVRQRHVGPAP